MDILILVDGFAVLCALGVPVAYALGLASILAADWPLCLAGGLDPANVGDAIRTVRPVAVDVSSGVETGGIKDPAKIEAFIRAAKRAFRDLATRGS